MPVFPRRLAVAAAVLLLSPVAAQAQLNAPVPTNATITLNGLQWAWANPVPADGGPAFGPSYGIDLSYQSAFGWRLPTTAELLLAPLARDFMYRGANVPFGGTDPVSGASFQATNPDLVTDAACATPYFGMVFHHCDWSDGRGEGQYDWAGTPGNTNPVADQLVVRSVATVPEPATIGLLATGLLGLAAATRRRRQTA